MQRPDYWELFSAGSGPAARPTPSTASSRRRPPSRLRRPVQRRHLQAWASGYVGEVRDYILFDYRTNMMGMSTSQARNVDARIMGGELGAPTSSTELEGRRHPGLRLGQEQQRRSRAAADAAAGCAPRPDLQRDLWSVGGPVARRGAEPRRRRTRATWSARTSARAPASACSRSMAYKVSNHLKLSAGSTTCSTRPTPSTQPGR
jgi:iron complex outermembrane receptor protein